MTLSRTRGDRKIAVRWEIPGELAGVERTVDYKGQQVSLSRAAVLANADRGGTATALQGPIWWLFEGETLASIRERLDDEW